MQGSFRSLLVQMLIMVNVACVMRLAVFFQEHWTCCTVRLLSWNFWWSW